MPLQARNTLRILLVSSDKFPPFRVDVSILFGKELVGRGHIIDWVLQSEKNLSRPYQTIWSDCDVFVGPTDNGTSKVKRAKKALYGLFHDLKMFTVLRARNHDFIMVRDKFISAVAAILISKIFKTKFVYWLSFPFPEDYLNRLNTGMARYPLIYWIKGHLFRILLYRIIIPCAEHTFVQSEEMKRNVALKGIPRKTMTPVPMAVSVNEIPFFGYKKGQSNPNNSKNILYLGTLSKIRKIDFLLRVFAGVIKKEKKARLLLVGSGDDTSDEQFLLNEARKLRINDSVIMTGFLPQEEAWRYVEKASVCVSPIYPSQTLNCGSPTKLIEYMAMGKAVVANDHPEQTLVISASQGGICVPWDEDAFVDAILYLLRYPDQAKKMGERGRQYVQTKRSYDKIAKIVESKLQSLCYYNNTPKKPATNSHA